MKKTIPSEPKLRAVVTVRLDIIGGRVTKKDLREVVEAFLTNASVYGAFVEKARVRDIDLD